MRSSSLHLSGLWVHAGQTPLLQDVSLSVQSGELIGIVGQSGSGKTLTALALLGLVEIRPGVTQADYRVITPQGEIQPYRQVLGKGPHHRGRAFAPVRGQVVTYLPQNPRTALNPLLRVGRQVAWSARQGDPHHNSAYWLARAGLPDPQRVARLYPHQLSGGMAARVVIAQSLARNSTFLVADEPTTGLDSSVQQELLGVFRQLTSEGFGVVLITHDLRLLVHLAHRVVIMHGGQVVETATGEQLSRGTLCSEPGRQLFRATQRIAAGSLGHLGVY